MGEAVGPCQALVMHFFLLAVSKTVGLRIDTHACLGAWVAASADAVKRRLSALPAQIRAGGLW
eukprot:9324641-Alexandrium_andersonii.AAC.1